MDDSSTEYPSADSYSNSASTQVSIHGSIKTHLSHDPHKQPMVLTHSSLDSFEFDPDKPPNLRVERGDTSPPELIISMYYGDTWRYIISSVGRISTDDRVYNIEGHVALSDDVYKLYQVFTDAVDSKMLRLIGQCCCANSYIKHGMSTDHFDNLPCIAADLPYPYVFTLSSTIKGQITFDSDNLFRGRDRWVWNIATLRENLELRRIFCINVLSVDEVAQAQTQADDADDDKFNLMPLRIWMISQNLTTFVVYLGGRGHPYEESYLHNLTRLSTGLHTDQPPVNSSLIIPKHLGDTLNPEQFRETEQLVQLKEMDKPHLMGPEASAEQEDHTMVEKGQPDVTKGEHPNSCIDEDPFPFWVRPPLPPLIRIFPDTPIDEEPPCRTAHVPSRVHADTRYLYLRTSSPRCKEPNGSDIIGPNVGIGKCSHDHIRFCGTKIMPSPGATISPLDFSSIPISQFGHSGQCPVWTVFRDGETFPQDCVFDGAWVIRGLVLSDVDYEMMADKVPPAILDMFRGGFFPVPMYVEIESNIIYVGNRFRKAVRAMDTSGAEMFGFKKENGIVKCPLKQLADLVRLTVEQLIAYLAQEGAMPTYFRGTISFLGVRKAEGKLEIVEPVPVGRWMAGTVVETGSGLLYVAVSRKYFSVETKGDVSFLTEYNGPAIMGRRELQLGKFLTSSDYVR